MEDFVEVEKEDWSATQSSSTTNQLTVLWERDNVAIYPTNCFHRGVLSICTDPSSNRHLIQWVPNSNSAPIDMYAIRVAFSDIQRIRVTRQALSYPQITMILNSGLAFPPLFFQSGGFSEFISQLKTLTAISRSPEDPGVFLFCSANDPQLHRSLTQLDLTMDAVNPSHVPSAHETIGIPPDTQAAAATTTTTATTNIPNSTTEADHNVVSDTLKELPWQVLGKFAKVSRFARDITSSGIFYGGSHTPETDGKNDHQQQQQQRSIPEEQAVMTSDQPPIAMSFPVDAVEAAFPVLSSSTLVASSSPALALVSSKPSELSSKRTSARLSMLEYLPPNHLYKKIFGEHFLLPKLTEGEDRYGKPLSIEEWMTFFDKEGNIVDIPRLQQRIFYGGLDAAVRQHGWKFLTSYLPWNSNAHQRQQLREAKAVEYKKIKLQWESISEEQEKRFRKFRERKVIIEKDVTRTDRSQPCFRDDEGDGIKHMQTILLSYTFYNFDLGYCQGMSDLLAPILSIVKDESEAFWCFAGVMDIMEVNFNKDQLGMKDQLNLLLQIVQIVLPKLYDYLICCDCDNMFYCFRWILIRFKREFSFPCVLRLWESLYSGYYGPNFHLFIAAAILEEQSGLIIEEKLDFDGLLMMINNLAGSMDLLHVMKNAERLAHDVADHLLHAAKNSKEKK